MDMEILGFSDLGMVLDICQNQDLWDLMHDVRSASLLSAFV